MTRRDMSPWQHQAIYNTKISGTHTWDLAEVMAGASPAEGQHLQACAVKGTYTRVSTLSTFERPSPSRPFSSLSFTACYLQAPTATAVHIRTSILPRCKLLYTQTRTTVF